MDSKSTQAKLSRTAWCCLSGVVATVLCWPSVARAQFAQNSPPGLLSSGSAGARSADPSAARDPNSDSAWTGLEHPAAAALSQRHSPVSTTSAFPNSSAAVVVTAAGSTAASPATDHSSGVSAGLRPAALASATQSVRAQTAASPSANASDSSKHIPLEPPSSRFTGEEPRGQNGTLPMLVSVGSSLLVVLGLFLGLAWCYKKTLHSSIAGGLPKEVVSVLGRSNLAARQQMVLVRFGPKLVLVSLIQGEARTLSEIDDPLQVDQLVGLCEAGQPSSISNSFKSVLLQEGARR